MMFASIEDDGGHHAHKMMFLFRCIPEYNLQKTHAATECDSNARSECKGQTAVHYDHSYSPSSRELKAIHFRSPCMPRESERGTVTHGILRQLMDVFAAGKMIGRHLGGMAPEDAVSNDAPATRPPKRARMASPRRAKEASDCDIRRYASQRDTFGPHNNGLADQARDGEGGDNNPLAGVECGSDYEPAGLHHRKARNVPHLHRQESSEREGYTVEEVDYRSPWRRVRKWWLSSGSRTPAPISLSAFPIILKDTYIFTGTSCRDTMPQQARGGSIGTPISG